MKKNVAGQIVGAQMNSKTNGDNVTTGTTTVYVTGDGGTQTTGSVGSGACTHEGKGFWTYAPAQAETNFDHVAFTFENTTAVTASVQLYPSFPQTGDNFARLGAPAGASLSADVAAVKTDTGAVKTKTDFLPSATAGAAGGVFIAGTNAATTVTSSLTTTFTGNLTGSVGSVTGSVGSVTGSVGSVTGAVGSVTGNVGGNVTGSVGSIATGGISAASFAADAINAAAIAAGAIDADALATDAVTEIVDAVRANLAPEMTEIGLIHVVTDKLDDTLEDDGGTFRFTANALEEAPSGGAAPTTAEIADKILGRDHMGGADGGRTVSQCLMPLRNKTTIIAGTMTVYEDDDTTTAWTAAVTTAPGDPLTSIDPA